jgi:hypothetical protein
MRRKSRHGIDLSCELYSRGDGNSDKTNRPTSLARNHEFSTIVSSIESSPTFSSIWDANRWHGDYNCSVLPTSMLCLSSCFTARISGAAVRRCFRTFFFWREFKSGRRRLARIISISWRRASRPPENQSWSLIAGNLTNSLPPLIPWLPVSRKESNQGRTKERSEWHESSLI